jgi:hypothetical protein
MMEKQLVIESIQRKIMWLSKDVADTKGRIEASEASVDKSFEHDSIEALELDLDLYQSILNLITDSNV